MLLNVEHIKNEDIFNYIISNRENARQFDEIEKRIPIIKALVTDLEKEDVRGVFEEILINF